MRPALQKTVPLQLVDSTRDGIGRCAELLRHRRLRQAVLLCRHHHKSEGLNRQPMRRKGGIHRSVELSGQTLDVPAPTAQSRSANAHGKRVNLITIIESGPIHGMLC